MVVKKLIDNALIANIISIVLAILSTYLGSKYSKAQNVAESVVSLLNKVTIAAKDDKVTEEEFQDLVDTATQVKEALGY